MHTFCLENRNENHAIDEPKMDSKQEEPAKRSKRSIESINGVEANNIRKRNPQMQQTKEQKVPDVNGMISNKRERKETQKLKDYKTGLKKNNSTTETQSKSEKSEISTKKEPTKKGKVYIIESLLKKEGSMFLVKWENYSDLWNSWEPKEGIPPFIVKVHFLRIQFGT